MMNRPLIVCFLLSLVALIQLTACAPAMRQTVLEENAVLAPTLHPRQSATATVNTRSLRVRNQPYAEAEVVWGVNAGETYKVVGRSTDGMWLQLELPKAPDGFGWVAADLVTVLGSIADAAIVEAPTPRPTVRARPPSSPLATPDATTVYATTNVPALPTATPRLASTPAPGYALVVTDGSRLRVRAAPTADAEIVGYIYPGETYRVLESSADGQWVRIAGAESTPTDNPLGGWVASSFLVVQ